MPYDSCSTCVCQTLEWSTPGPIPFSSSPDCVIILFSECSIGFLDEILHSLETYNLMPYIHLWQRVSIFPSYKKWKHIVNSRIFKHERAYFLTASEEKPVAELTLTAFASYSPSFWSLTWNNSHLVAKNQNSKLQRTSDITCTLCEGGNSQWRQLPDIIPRIIGKIKKILPWL